MPRGLHAAAQSGVCGGISRANPEYSSLTLAAFPGLESQRQAIEHGAKFSGCTVHFVDENLDAGPIILQAAVPIRDDDTPESLSERVLKEEHRIYTEAVRIVLEGRYRMEGRRVLLTNLAASAEKK